MEKKRLGEGADALERRRLVLLGCMVGCEGDIETGEDKEGGTTDAGTEGCAMAQRFRTMVIQKQMSAQCRKRNAGCRRLRRSASSSSSFVPEAGAYGAIGVRMVRGDGGREKIG